MGAIRDMANQVYADGPAGNETQPVKSEIRQLHGLTEDRIDGAAAGEVSVATWTALAATPGTRTGQPGRVQNTDSGTHTDPVVGGTVNNAGEYSWSTSPAGWRRIGNLPSTDVEAVINGAAAKATLVDGDTFGVTDSAASNVIKKHTWANLKAGVWGDLGALIAGGTGKATPVDADTIPLSDSAASNASKKLTWANLKGGVWSAFGALVAGGVVKSTIADNDVFAIGDSAASNASKKVTWATMLTRTFFGLGPVVSSGANRPTPANADTLLISNSDSAHASSRISFSALAAGVLSRINIMSLKAKLVPSDLFIIGDSAASYVGKRTTLGDLMTYIEPSIPFGALRKLRIALDDPLTQLIGIVFMGDSITWGATVTGNAVSTPRDGTLSDPRDNATTPSWVNNLKAYVGAVYFPDATPVHTNWVDAPSGEAITTLKKTALLYPGQEPFEVHTDGASVSFSSVQTYGVTKLGYRFNLSDGNGAGTSTIGVRFPFTGEEFTLWYTSVAGNSTDYTLLINGVSQGDFSTNSGSNQNELSRVHTFDYVRDAIIEIRLKRTEGGGVKNLWLEAIEVEKTVVMTNQGIIGSDTRRQRVFILSGTFDTLPFTDVDKFIFYQIGTNNRGWQTEATLQPTGVLTLKDGMNQIIDRTYELVSDAEIVLMAANMTTDYDGENFAFDMDQVRGTLRQVADERRLDFIDNYSIFRGVDLGTELADGLHPNDAGHLRMSNNIIARIEAS